MNDMSWTWPSSQGAVGNFSRCRRLMSNHLQDKKGGKLYQSINNLPLADIE
jgi:hypothetical protein